MTDKPTDLTVYLDTLELILERVKDHYAMGVAGIEQDRLLNRLIREVARIRNERLGQQ